MRIWPLLSVFVAMGAFAQANPVGNPGDSATDDRLGVMVEVKIVVNQKLTESTKVWARQGKLASVLMDQAPAQLDVNPVLFADGFANVKLAFYAARGQEREILESDNVRLQLDSQNHFALWDRFGNAYDIYLQPHLAPSPQICAACSGKPVPSLLGDPGKPNGH